MPASPESGTGASGMTEKPILSQPNKGKEANEDEEETGNLNSQRGL